MGGKADEGNGLSTKPMIVTNASLEPEFEDRLGAVGELRRVARDAPRGDVLAAIRNARGFLGWTTVDAALLDTAPHLRVVSLPAVGYDSVDVDLATKRGIVVCNTPGVLNAAVADLTMAMIIMLARRLPEFEAYSRRGGWGRKEPNPGLGHDIAGKMLGVIGFGRIGREVTRRMQGLGMQTIWYDRFDRAPPDAPGSDYRSLDDLLQESDFVTIHSDLNPSSHHLVGEREIGLMRQTAYIINTSRGGSVDQAALTAALAAGRIAGAALDVLEKEPPDPDEPIVRLPNVITYPHIGTATEETRRAMRGMAVDNLIAVLSDQPPLACVNPEVLATRTS